MCLKKCIQLSGEKVRKIQAACLILSETVTSSDPMVLSGPYHLPGQNLTFGEQPVITERARSRPQIINGPELKSSIDTFLLHLWVSQVDSVLGPSGRKTGI